MPGYTTSLSALHLIVGTKVYASYNKTIYTEKLFKTALESERLKSGTRKREKD